MRLAFRSILVVLLFSLISGCSSAPSQTILPTASPSPAIPIETPYPTSQPEPTLTAGQWNRLFYHPQLQKVILVNGGPDRGKPASDPLELWAWDGENWTLLSANPDGPAWRNFAGAAFDSKRNVLVVQGGVQDRDQRMEDTWEWDGETWRQFTGSGPGFREGAAMTYDEALGNTILYGGADEKFEILGDTWAWDGGWWTQVSATGPAPRFPSAIVYDQARERILLFSGHFVSASDFINYNDFWEWDGSAWKEILTQGEKPPGRNIAEMVYIPASETVVLFGGGQAEFESDVWTWDGASWTHSPEKGAPARSGMGAAYDARRDRLVTFGGVEKPGGKAVTDTWEWDGEKWECVHGCQ